MEDLDGWRLADDGVGVDARCKDFGKQCSFQRKVEQDRAPVEQCSFERRVEQDSGEL